MIMTLSTPQSMPLGSQQFPTTTSRRSPDPSMGPYRGLHAPGVRPQHLVGQLADGVHRQGLWRGNRR